MNKYLRLLNGQQKVIYISINFIFDSLTKGLG